MGTENDRVDDYVKLSFFNEIGKAITSACSMNEVLHVVMEKIGSIFAPANWSLLLRNHKTGQLTFILVTGSGTEGLRGRCLERGQGVAGWIAEHGQAVIIENVKSDDRFDSTMDESIGFTTSSIIGVPLKTRTRVFGVIELINRLDGQDFTKFDLHLLSTIGDFAAIAIEKLYYIQALKRSATTDQLTGLYNRRLLVPFIQREVDRFRRNSTPFAIFFIDVNKFKQVNDIWGHDVGDEVLRDIAGVFRKVVRRLDFVCRWGGDEFVVVLPDIDTLEAEAIRERILCHEDIGRLMNRYGIGLSIVVREALDEDAENLLIACDRDMYTEKMNSISDDPEDMPTALEDMLQGELANEKMNG